MVGVGNVGLIFDDHMYGFTILEVALFNSV